MPKSLSRGESHTIFMLEMRGDETQEKSFGTISGMLYLVVLLPELVTGIMGPSYHRRGNLLKTVAEWIAQNVKAYSLIDSGFM